MGSAQEVLIRGMGFLLMVAGALYVVRGGFAGHKNKDDNDEMNLKGWKGLGSNWAMGGIVFTAGTYTAFMKFFNTVFAYIFGPFL